MAHRNPNEWHYPDKFMPERFDPESEYFKTPNGKARHPLSFIPFSFGERKCLGYQFANVIIPTLISRIIFQVDLEFTDRDLTINEDKYPVATLG